MIYLIGGAPRIGKTTLVKHLVRKQPMHAISTDAIRYMLRRSIDRDALPPDIFINFHEDVMARWKIQHPQATLEEQNRQSRAYWPALDQLAQSYDEDGADVIIEGVAILPEFSQQLDVPHKSIYIGNTSPTHAEFVIARAKANEHDWMHNYSDEELASATAFFTHMSKFYRDEAAKYSESYREVRNENYDSDLEAAADALLG
jgi:2-phosphoglycerate kinase